MAMGQIVTLSVHHCDDICILLKRFKESVALIWRVTLFLPSLDLEVSKEVLHGIHILFSCYMFYFVS